MKIRKVISPKQLPMRSPVLGAIVFYLLLDHIHGHPEYGSELVWH